jgi:hypothetical protein
MSIFEDADAAFSGGPTGYQCRDGAQSTTREIPQRPRGIGRFDARSEVDDASDRRALSSGGQSSVFGLR